MKRILIAALMVVLTGGSASAGFINNYGDWRSSTKDEMDGYVQGVMDYLMTFVFSNQEGSRAETAGFRVCSKKVGLTDAMLTEGVSEAYKSHPNRWKDTAAVLVYGFMRHLCLDEINMERSKDGLKPLKKWDDW